MIRKCIFLNYDNITIGTILSEIDLEKQNNIVYNNSLVAVPTGNTSEDGSLEYIIQSISDYNLITHTPKIVEIFKDTVTKTFNTNSNCCGIAVINLSATVELTLTINDITITIPPNNTFDDYFNTFDTFTITLTGTGSYEVLVKEV
jgi:hypothetical protein